MAQESLIFLLHEILRVKWRSMLRTFIYFLHNYVSVRLIISDQYWEKELKLQIRKGKLTE